jgi:phosphatidylglycerol lysyltransferase
MLMTPHHKSAHAFVTVGRSVLALAVGVVAVANVVSALATNPWQPAVFGEHIIDLDGLGWGPHGAIVVALLLLLVARALAKGKRQAWCLAVTLFAFSLLSTIVSRQHMSYAPVALTLLVALLVLSPIFNTRSDPHTLRRGYSALVLSLACFAGLGLVRAFWHHEMPQVTIVERSVVLFLLRGLLFLFLGYGVVEVLRPVLTARHSQRDERARVRRLVRRHATLATSYFLLGADKAYFWSRSERSFIAYRLANGVALVLADPIGPAEERAPLLVDFIAYCRKQDWQIAFYQASTTTQQLCRAHGLQALKVGEEAIINVARFTTQGKAGAPVRHSIARAKRDGLTVQCWQGEQPPDTILAGMRRVSQAWLGADKARMQFGFSMGRFPADWSPELLTTAALDPQGEVRAFLTWTPLYQGNGWSLDVMRRTKGTPPGTMEMLIAESIEWANAKGYAHMSLGLAPLAGLDATAETGLITPSSEDVTSGASHRFSWLERSAAYLHQRKLLLGNYASLYHFKAKFNPAWEARYLIVPDARSLPRTLSALALAHGYSWATIAGEVRAALPTPATLTRRSRARALAEHSDTTRLSA